MSVDTLPWAGDVLAEYQDALWSEVAMTVRDCSGRALPFDIPRWSAQADTADQSMLARCEGPTLDIGCGPGRLVAALAHRGLPALGVDIAPAAVALTRAGGASALRRSVFDPLPGEGRWRFALLADGNIGIGGNAARLLGRVRELLAPGGVVLIEADPHGRTETVLATVHSPENRPAATFPWLHISAPDVCVVGAGLGLTLAETWSSGGRCFVALRKAE
ncbi:MAG: methyltransferase domain-containing protein [Sporichthyaceae bacterium]